MTPNEEVIKSCLPNKPYYFSFHFFFQDDPNKNLIIFWPISFQMILPTWQEQPERKKVEEVKNIDEFD